MTGRQHQTVHMMIEYLVLNPLSSLRVGFGDNEGYPKIHTARPILTFKKHQKAKDSQHQNSSSPPKKESKRVQTKPVQQLFLYKHLLAVRPLVVTTSPA
jgi:hypothetical protein